MTDILNGEETGWVLEMIEQNRAMLKRKRDEEPVEKVIPTPDSRGKLAVQNQ